MQRLLSLILLAAIGVVGWRVYTTWSATETLPTSGGRRTAPGLDLPSTARTPPPPKLAANITARDLFDESRRPPATEVVSSEPLPPPNVELIGVLIVGPEPEALVKDTTQGDNLLHVFKGDDVGGYTVSKITATEVVLTSPAGEEVPLPLPLNRGAPPAKAERKGAKTTQRADQAKRPTAAGATEKAGRTTGPAGVRERLRELRRKRREANKARRE
jgi:hypothetical protein